MAVLWQTCFGKEWCVRIPFDGERCLKAEGCIRLVERNADFFIEIDAAGLRREMPLGNGCMELRWYVFAAKACIQNVAVSDRNIHFDVAIKLCIDASIGPISIGECVDVFRQHVAIGRFTPRELAASGMSPPYWDIGATAVPDIFGYCELEVSADARKALDAAFANMP